MKWFSGKVDIAIQVSARNKALLAVFIDSGDESGEAMDKVWGEIDNSILSCNHIALKIKDQEDVAKIISLMPESERFDAPVSLFITSAGEVVGKVTAADVAQLKDVVSQVNQKLAPKKIESQVIPIVPSSASSASSTTPSSAPSTAPSTSQSQDPSTSSTEPQTRPPISRAEKELLLQEKMNRARVLLEQKKKADAELKRREEKKKEMERIKESKIAAEAEKKRQEKEMRDAAKQRKVDLKMVEQERLRVRAQFLADREEKDFREFSRTGQFSSENVRRRDPYVAPPVDNGRVRILVRFTDGRTITDTFESSSPFTAVLDSINESGFIFKPYTLVRPYPRTQYTAADYTKSFLELQLTPSCVLYVQEESEKKGFFNQGIFSLFTMVIKAPFTALSAIYGMIFGMPQRTLNFDGDGPTVMAPETARQVRDMDSLRHHRVTRLYSSEDGSESDSDENPNWNGNSTQYL